MGLLSVAFFISQSYTEGSQRTTEKVIKFNSVVLCAALRGSLCNIFVLFCRDVHFKINQVETIVSRLFIKIESSELSIFVNIIITDEKDIFFQNAWIGGLPDAYQFAFLGSKEESPG